MIGLFDPHIGKRAYGNETRRGHYDLPIAVKTLREAGADQIAKGNERKVTERLFFVGGDFYNADTKAGTTTGGTPQDNDSRLPKMLTEGAAALFDLINWSAQFCQTKVMVVPGNHDSSLSWALQLALQCEFRKDKRVIIDAGVTTRKYHRHGKCLLGLTHGDKAWKRLPSLMSREAASEWGMTTLRHIHHGHLHSKRQVDTVEGVTVFQHPALCESDSWHAEEGYVSDRGQESYYYHESGRLVGMDYYSPDIDIEVPRGTR
jgi:DNA repair exonuclease SbcCD nuclease subunit